MKEIWKDVKDYEGLYQVSNLGNVRKLRFINNIANKEKIFMITPQLINSGYYKVMLSKNGGSLIDAAHYVNVDKSCHIVSCCKGKLKTAYGYKWEYGTQISQ